MWMAMAFIKKLCVSYSCALSFLIFSGSYGDKGAGIRIGGGLT
jgi:hypothetical protein